RTMCMLPAFPGTRARPRRSESTPAASASVRRRTLSGVPVRCGGVRLEVIHGVADRLELVGILVGDVETELLLERHDQLDDVERIRAEVLDELLLRREGVDLDLQLLGDDLPHPVFTERCHSVFTSCSSRGPPGTGA